MSQDGAPGPIRDLVDSGIKFKKGRSVDFSKTGGKNSEGTDMNAKVTELNTIEAVDLGCDQMNEAVADIKFARDKIKAKVLDKSPEAEKSFNSKKGLKKKTTRNNNPLASTIGSINESGMDVLGSQDQTTQGMTLSSLHGKAS